jgi:hypothetical protein
VGKLHSILSKAFGVNGPFWRERSAFQPANLIRKLSCGGGFVVTYPEGTFQLIGTTLALPVLRHHHGPPVHALHDCILAARAYILLEVRRR